MLDVTPDVQWRLVTGLAFTPQMMMLRNQWGFQRPIRIFRPRVLHLLSVRKAMDVYGSLISSSSKKLTFLKEGTDKSIEIPETHRALGFQFHEHGVTQGG